MKRYNNLYEKVFDLENIKLAHKNARKGKTHYSAVKMVDADPDKYFEEIHALLKNKTFKNAKYKMFIKMDKGKRREIFKLPYFPDRIIQHAIMIILEPIWMSTLITDTYSSLKDRGIHKGVKRIKKALKDRDNTKYCLKTDVKKFYPSIDHDILKNIIRRKIKDKDLLWILDVIIDSSAGVPIGNYLSQYFGNLYLSSLDHWLKEEKKCQYVFRYCDDICILDSDKKHLSNLREEISVYLEDKLKLTLKENWQVFPVAVRGIDFLGYRFFHDYTLLRKGTATRFKRRLKSIRKNYRVLSPINIISGIMSYIGWMKFADCYRLQSKYVDRGIKSIVFKICAKYKMNNPLKALNA